MLHMIEARRMVTAEYIRNDMQENVKHGVYYMG